MSVNADVAAEATLRLPAEPSDQRPRGALARFLLRQAMRAAGREVGPHLRGRDPIRVRSLEHDEPGGRGGKSHTLFFIRAQSLSNKTLCRHGSDKLELRNTLASVQWQRPLSDCQRI